MKRAPWRPLAAAGAVALLFALAGCGGSRDADVEAVARGFYQRLADGDTTSACALLSSRTRSEVEKSSQAPCAEGLKDEDLPQVDGPTSAEVFGVMAQVQFTDADGAPLETTFLSRYGDRWRITSAGCVGAGASTPYDCQVSGG